MRKKYIKLVFSCIALILLPNILLSQIVDQKIGTVSGNLKYLENLIDGELDWISRAQINMPGKKCDGALTVFPVEDNDINVANVYISNYAALALLEKPGLYAKQVRRYIKWYFRNLNRQPDFYGLAGTVYNYLILPDGTQIYSDMANPNGFPGHPEVKLYYDASDSLTAVFLLVLKKYHQVTGDTKLIKRHRNDIELIAQVNIKTADKLGNTDGIPFGLPWDYNGKWVMDTVEVYWGFESMIYLCDKVFNESNSAKFWDSRKRKLSRSIEAKYWDREKEMYKIFIDDTDWGPEPDWANFNIDVLVNMFYIYGDYLSEDKKLINPYYRNQRMKHIYDNINKHYPTWYDYSIPVPVPYHLASNPYLTAAAAHMGDYKRSIIHIKSIENKYITNGREYPWNTLESSTLVIAADALRNKLTKRPTISYSR